MSALVIIFLKIFYRNPRGLFFTILMPAGIFLVAGLFGSRGVIDFRSNIPYGDFLLPGMIAYALMQAGVYSTAYSLIDYKRGKVLQRLSVTPLRAGEFLFAHVIARFVVAILQAGMLTALAMAFFSVTLPATAIFLVPLIFVGGGMFLNFGFMIAAIARDYEEAAPYTVLVALPLLFLGDVFFPVNNLPQSIATLASYLPLQPLTAAMRYSLGIGPVGLRDIAVMFAWFIAGLIFSHWLFRKKAYG